MKKNPCLLLVILFISGSNYLLAQGNEKVKGNRDVTIEQVPVAEFNKIVLGEDFTADIVYNKSTSVQVEADGNLHEYLKIEVVDSVLKFSTTAPIGSKKKMHFTINYGDSFHEIEVLDDAEIRSLTSLEIKNAMVKTDGSSKAYLNIKTDNFKFVALDRAKIRLNLTAQNSEIEMSDNSRLDGLITSTTSNIDLYQRAHAYIEGDALESRIRVDNNSKFDGRNFTNKTCNLVAEIGSEAHVDVSETINVQVSGSSEIYLYNEPKITLERFSDTARLQKKIK
ncbi:GIN domain-containing protein [Aegicerativicinus sediminis]|uniref:GIN domain-containing protein n=1 Tax=Aegicerativicinus sediminis TaxID=2893202 RepID=UPI001E5C6389|nr:DUF2807 domain-containing protein [Aegicerativicinus sediminis]